MQMNSIQDLTNPVYVLTQVLNSVKARTAEVEARLARLIKEAEPMAWGSAERETNWQNQRQARGELLGLAHAEGALEGRISATKIWMA